MDNLTRAEKAIKIAEYEGWELTSDLLYKAPNGTDNTTLYKSYLIDIYSSFNGLMPIVERVNKANDINGFEITYFEITAFTQADHRHFELEDVDLIDCLQDAIIFYHENKEK